jgi:hypothetical protein
LKVKLPPSKSILPVALTAPVTSNSTEGEALLIPTLSLPASVKIRCVAVFPSILKSLSAPASLNTKVPPLKFTSPATSNVPLAVMFPQSSKTSNIVEPSEYKICLAPCTSGTPVPPDGLNVKVLPECVVASSTMYHVSTASVLIVVAPDKVPVSLMTALLCSSAVVPSFAVNESLVLATATDT